MRKVGEREFEDRSEEAEFDYNAVGEGESIDYDYYSDDDSDFGLPAPTLSAFSLEELKLITLMPLIDMSRASPTTPFSLTEAYQRSTTLVHRYERDIKINPFEPKYANIRMQLNRMPVPAAMKDKKEEFEAYLEKQAKKKYTESAIKAAYFALCFKKAPNQDINEIQDQVEEAYQNAKEVAFDLFDLSNENTNQWKFYETIIENLMKQSGCDRNDLPKEKGIDKRFEEAVQSSKENQAVTDANINVDVKPAMLHQASLKSKDKDKKDKEKDAEPSSTKFKKL